MYIKIYAIVYVYVNSYYLAFSSPPPKVET